jgi:hypothetical protein
MRKPLAIVTLFGVLALNTTADAAQKGYYTAPPRYLSERAVCEARAQHADPSGQYAGYPCWAREAFSRGRTGGRR